MNVRFVPIMLVMALAGMTTPSMAQEERGQLWDVQTITVRPDHMDEFMETVGMVKAAAAAANLPAEYGWHIWVQDFDVAIASMAPDMAAFDDPEAWMRAFQGTPGEAMMTEAMGKFMNEISSQSGLREVYEQVEAWSYVPANPTFEDAAHAERFDFWVKPGMQEQLEKVITDIMAFQAKLESPYPINGYRMHFGDTGRVTFLVMNDGWADYYGKNDMEAKMEATGTSAEWEAIMTEMRDCLSAFESSRMDYVADLSYTGPGM